jgi:small nuclear ribonucleoprotein (snRNP)-like protein
MVILKNDSVQIGRFVSEEGQSILFQVFNETKKIAKKDIKKLEIGYSGIPSCYKRKKNWSETCGQILHSFDKNKIILGKGDGLLDKEEIELKELSMIRMKKNKKEDKFLYILKSGIKVELKVNKEIIKGEIRSIDSNHLVILDDKSNNRKFTELEVDEIFWENTSTGSYNFLTYIIPGVMQYRNGKKLKGSLMGFFFFGLIAGAASEYSAAGKALNDDIDYLIINNNVYIGSNLNPNPAFEGHIRNMNYAIGGAVLLYLFHSYEVYSFITSKGVKTSLNVKPFIPYGQDVNNQNLHSTIEFRFSYSF